MWKKSANLFNRAERLNECFDNLPILEEFKKTSSSEDDNLDKEIIRAVYEGYLFQLEKLLSDEYNPNKLFFQDRIIKLDHEVNDEIVFEPFYYSLLSLACVKGHYDVVKWLVERGAEIDKKTEIKDDEHLSIELKNPVILSCEMGYLEILNYLLAHKSIRYIKDIKDIRGKTLVDIAVETNNDIMLRYLIEDESFYPSIYTACEKGSISTIKYLIRIGHKLWNDYSVAGMYDRYSSDGKRTPVECAGNNLKVIKFLLSQGAEPSILGINYEVDSNKQKKSLNKIIELLDFLIKYGANAEGDSESTFTPIILAITAKNYTAFKFLIEKGANYNKHIFVRTFDELTDLDTYQTPLYYAKNLLKEILYDEDHNNISNETGSASYEVKQLKQIINHLTTLNARDYIIGAEVYDDYMYSIHESLNPYNMDNYGTKRRHMSMDDFIKKYNRSNESTQI